ncbi:MAG: guanylate kinase [Anaerolineae bacterium]
MVSADVDMNDAEAFYRWLHHPHPVLVVISGPSGVGKDSVVKRMQELGYPFHFVVTATSRPPRPNEVDGVDYHFVSEAEFERMIDAGELIEHALVYGQYKGIPKKHIREALASGQDVIMRIDVQGAATVRRIIPQAVTIFLTAESEEDLIRRLRERRTESEEALELRIATARQELRRVGEFDYVVVNRYGHLDETVEQVAAIVRAEKCRVDWEPIRL